MLKRLAAIRITALCMFWLITSVTQAVVLRDDRNIDVTITKPPQRIVSLLPSLTETCLLYTSPSPRDRSVSRMPSSA